MLVFGHDYEGKSSSSNGLLWISFIFLKINYFLNCPEALQTNLYMLTKIKIKINNAIYIAHVSTLQSAQGAYTIYPLVFGTLQTCPLILGTISTPWGVYS